MGAAKGGTVNVSKSVGLLLKGREMGPLESLAVLLASRLDECESDRDATGLSRELRLVLAEIRSGDRPLEQGIDKLIGALSEPVAE